jgi:hypothetical protein
MWTVLASIAVARAIAVSSPIRRMMHWPGLEIVSIPVDKLGALVASLTDQSQLIVAALDGLFT